MPEKQAFHLMSCTNSEIPELAQVAEFYDRALLVASGGLLSYGCTGRPDLAENEAQELTERRFGIRLILPGEAE